MVKRSRPWHPISVCVAVAALSIPMLASSPQDPDGVELVMVARHGGVLHPPGFPLMAWLARLVGLIAPDRTALGLSIFSLLCQLATLALLPLVYAESGMSAAGALLAVGCFAFFPSAWALALQPEKYALTALMLTLVLLFFNRHLARSQSLKTPAAIALGVIFGAALSVHPATVVTAAMPAFLLFRLFEKKKHRLALIMMASALLTSLASYSSLYFLTTPNRWPDWGKFRTPGELAQHVLFTTPLLRLADQSAPFRGTRFFFSSFGETYGVLGGLLLLAGVYACLRRKDAARCLAWTGGFALTLLFLFAAKDFGDYDYAAASLLRFACLGAFFAAGLIGFGFDLLINKYGPARLRKLAIPLSIAMVATLAVRERSAADLSGNNVIDIYREAVGASLPATSIYVSGTDVENFGGVPTANGTRFPLFMNYPWYLERVVPLLDSRLQFKGSYRPSIEEIAQRAYAQGLAVSSTNLAFLTMLGHPVEQRGLLGVVQKGVENKRSAETVAAAEELCVVLSRRLHALPLSSDYYALKLWGWMMDALDGAALYLDSTKNYSKAARFREAAEAMRMSNDAKKLTAACDAVSDKPKPPKK